MRWGIVIVVVALAGCPKKCPPKAEGPTTEPNFAEIDIECANGATFTLTTGTPSGQCKVNQDENGNVMGGACADNAGNGASAECNTNGGKGSCTGSSGNGDCDHTPP